MLPPVHSSYTVRVTLGFVKQATADTMAPMSYLVDHVKARPARPTCIEIRIIHEMKDTWIPCKPVYRSLQYHYASYYSFKDIYRALH